MKNRKYIFIGAGISLVYLLIHLVIMNDYGLSWDFHYHLYAGLYHLGFSVPKITDPSPVPFTSPDPRLTLLDPFGPFTQIIPALSYALFYQIWHILPPDSAYNLPMIIFGSAGIGVLFFFLLELFSFPIAFFSSLFLSLTPNYFGYLHTNMKDIPNAVAFTLALYLFWRLVVYKRIKDLILAVLSFAFAFNIKINSIMIPIVCFIWYGITYFKKVTHIIFLYFILAPVAAILLWLPFWPDPIGKLRQLPSFYSQNTLHMPVLFLGQIVRSGVNISWIYPYVYIIITTPLPILIFILFGLSISLYQGIAKKNGKYFLLILWFFVPLLRYMSPKASAIDGVRHFMEVVYPLASFAGIGWVFLSQAIEKKIGNMHWKALQGIVLLHIIIFLFLIKNLVMYHPYQTSFFNSLIGGIAGAQGKFDIDFWATPQKEAVLWLNKHASYGAYIHIVMAQSSAAVYIRDDLLKNLNTRDMFTSDYTVILNRQSFFSLYPVEAYLLQKSPKKEIVYERKIEDVPLVQVFKNE